MPVPIRIRAPKPSPDPQPKPAAVVISGPAEIFVRHPGPANIGVGPVTIRVRSPIGVTNGDARLPAIAIIGYLNPVAVVQVVVEEIDRDVRVRARLLRDRKRHRHNRQCHKNSFHLFHTVSVLDLRVPAIIHANPKSDAPRRVRVSDELKNGTIAAAQRRMIACDAGKRTKPESDLDRGRSPIS